MRKFFIIFLIPIIISVFFACSSSEQVQPTSENTDEDEYPDWFINKPVSEDYIYGVGTATSRDLQIAIDKAALSARQKIASELDIKMQGLQKRFTEETGLAEDSQMLDNFTQATKSVVDQSMQGSKVTKQKPTKEGSIWRAYVLVELSIGDANKRFLDKIKSEEQMYTRFRETQAFKELDQEIEKNKE